MLLFPDRYPNWYHNLGQTFFWWYDLIFRFNLSVIHDPEDPYLSAYDEEIIVMLTDYHHVDSEILLKSFLSPESGGEEVN